MKWDGHSGPGWGKDDAIQTGFWGLWSILTKFERLLARSTGSEGDGDGKLEENNGIKLEECCSEMETLTATKESRQGLVCWLRFK